jgi:prophage antirepressor-like protein
MKLRVKRAKSETGQQTFYFRGKPVRVVNTPNGPQFVLADVCSILGLSEEEALATLKPDGLSVCEVSKPDPLH